MSDDIQSLRRQLAELKENLRLIQEQKSKFVLETDIPLQLIKEERRLEVQIADLRERLEVCQEQLTRPYEQLQDAAAQEDWSEVLALGEQIQVLDAGYRDVPGLMAQARERLRRPQRRLISSWTWIVGGAMALTLLVGLIGWRAGWFAPNRPPAGASRYDTWTRPVDKMVMVYVPAGEFEMGSTEGRDNEQPVHAVALDGFWIDQAEVTNAQYRRCVEAGACQAPMTCDWGEPTYEDLSKADYPVVCVDWYGAQTYCEWAGARLPTEAEWEYAARGPEGFIYPWGDEFDCSLGNFDDETQVDDHVNPGGEGCDGYVKTAPVESFPGGASWCDALDMAGNVWEWVADWYRDYPSGRQVNPMGPSSGSVRVQRGGSWYNPLDCMRGAYRDVSPPDVTSDNWGFRCARDSE
jgi:formylglycine-generating enzyme required for sulfatase activity